MRPSVHTLLNLPPNGGLHLSKWRDREFPIKRHRNLCWVSAQNRIKQVVVMISERASEEHNRLAEVGQYVFIDCREIWTAANRRHFLLGKPLADEDRSHVA